MDHLSKKWTLKSLTIGPQKHEINVQYWKEAFRNSPPLRSGRFHHHISKTTPRRMRLILIVGNTTSTICSPVKVHIRPSCRSQRASFETCCAIHDSLLKIRTMGLGLCRLSAFKQDHRTDTLYETRVCTELPEW